MEGSQVKELIQTWRGLSNALKEKNAELERTRATLQETESQHAATVRDWDLEKANIQNTISLVWTQVSAKKEQLARIEEESLELQRKVDERRVRNEEHWRVLNKRKQVVKAQLQEMEEKDKGARERLCEFREVREESKQQLLFTIQKLEGIGQQEQMDHHQKTRQLQSKIADMEAATESEKKSWTLEVAMREWKQKSDARKWLFEEVAVAEKEQGMWAEIVREVNNLGCEDYLKELDALRALISC